MLAVVFALNKFDQYIYGSPVTVQSDHKLLSAIASKSLRSAPKRLQGMLLKVQKYTVSIVYKPGRETLLADTLSSAFLANTENTWGKFDHMNAVKLLPMTDESLEEINGCTHDDEILQQLKTHPDWMARGQTPSTCCSRTILQLLGWAECVSKVNALSSPTDATENKRTPTQLPYWH